MDNAFFPPVKPHRRTNGSCSGGCMFSTLIIFLSFVPAGDTRWHGGSDKVFSLCLQETGKPGVSLVVAKISVINGDYSLA
jgi:hypothetical protein